MIENEIKEISSLDDIKDIAKISNDTEFLKGSIEKYKKNLESNNRSLNEVSDALLSLII